MLKCLAPCEERSRGDLSPAGATHQRDETLTETDRVLKIRHPISVKVDQINLISSDTIGKGIPDDGSNLKPFSQKCINGFS